MRRKQHGLPIHHQEYDDKDDDHTKKSATRRLNCFRNRHCTGTIIFSFLLVVLAFFFISIISLPGESLSKDANKPYEFDAPTQIIDLNQFTVRINTWKRVEQLQVVVQHYLTCDSVAQVQIVWCDAQGEPPLFSDPKVIVERHALNSLNERFRLLHDPPTLAVLSVDDDLLRPCLALDSAFITWTHNPRRMIGFDARTHVVHPNGTWAYGYLSTTEHTNRYSIALTRCAFCHRDYLYSYIRDLPKYILEEVQRYMNCEDIAMSFWISHHTNGLPPLLAPIWAMKSMVKLDPGVDPISAMATHKTLRDRCVDDFAKILGLKSKLVPTVYIHGHSFWNAGAPAVMDAHPPSKLEARITETLDKWKSSRDIIRELGVLRQEMSLVAYEKGLVEQTEPWKLRFRSSAKNNHTFHTLA